MRIQFFDSYRKMLEAERRAREAADARVQDWQREIKPGDCFVSPTEHGFNIYGVALKGYRQDFLRNYLYCNCYSAVCPTGERGDTHVSTIGALISREDFEEAKKRLREGSEPEL